MCGIAGILGSAHKPGIESLERMNARLTHRGPDDDGIYQDGSIGLTHTRLSIIDLETGQQPIFNEDDSVVVVFNGEIYNYRELRNSLTGAGHQFSTETDTEVLVHLYEEYGVSFLDRLEGQFAFALWDREKERLILARDPMGIKPLLIGQSNGRYYFGSELPAVLASDIDHGGLDQNAVGLYFAFGFIPAPHTIFQNISKLEPGEYAVISDGTMIRDSFFQVESAPQKVTGLKDSADELRSRIENAVEKRLMSDVKLGAFLSGGIDSSIIVATMSSLLDDPVNTFTIGFDESRYDESWAAEEVADYHDTNHHEYVMNPSDLKTAIPNVLDRLGEPFADPSLLPSYIVSQQTSQEVKVALSGDGADELFLGYDKYLVEYFSRYYRLLPDPARRILSSTLASMPTTGNSRLSKTAYQLWWFTDRASQVDTSRRHFSMMRRPEGEAIDTVDGVESISRGEAFLEHEHSTNPTHIRDADALKQIQTVDVRCSLPNQMLRKVDTASMFNSLEVRTPFLDTDVVSLALGMPTNYKMTGRNRKRVLKRAFEDQLPDAILNRGKRGFDMPIGEWLRHDLRDDFRDIVRKRSVGALESDAILSVFDEHIEGHHDHTKFLWSVYVFKHWLNSMYERGVLSESYEL